MSKVNKFPFPVIALRWIARVWSLMLLVRGLIQVFLPDKYAVYPLPLTELIEMGFYGLALVGLLLAWRWEGIGGWLAIAGLIGHAIAFSLFRQVWMVQLAPLILYGVPAVLYIICWAVQGRQPRFVSNITT